MVHKGRYRYHCDKCGHGLEKKSYLATHRCNRVRRDGRKDGSDTKKIKKSETKKPKERKKKASRKETSLRSTQVKSEVPAHPLGDYTLPHHHAHVTPELPYQDLPSGMAPSGTTLNEPEMSNVLDSYLNILPEPDPTSATFHTYPGSLENSSNLGSNADNINHSYTEVSSMMESESSVLQPLVALEQHTTCTTPNLSQELYNKLQQVLRMEDGVSHSSYSAPSMSSNATPLQVKDYGSTISISEPCVSTGNISEPLVATVNMTEPPVPLDYSRDDTKFIMQARDLKTPYNLLDSSTDNDEQPQAHTDLSLQMNPLPTSLPDLQDIPLGTRNSNEAIDTHIQSMPKDDRYPLAIGGTSQSQVSTLQNKDIQFLASTLERLTASATAGSGANEEAMSMVSQSRLIAEGILGLIASQQNTLPPVDTIVTPTGVTSPEVDNQ